MSVDLHSPLVDKARASSRSLRSRPATSPASPNSARSTDGVGASRFGARVALDLLDGRRTERTALKLVSRPPAPFPPEPLRYPIVQVTKAAPAREDRTGRRGAFLGLLDRFGVGFNS